MKDSIHLLIVEHNASDTELVISELSKQYIVRTRRVDSIEKFANILKSERFDLILCNEGMPGFSGLDALALLQQEGIDIPFIVVSGLDGEELAVQAIKAGAYNFVALNNLQRLIPVVGQAVRDAEKGRAHKRPNSSVHDSDGTFSTLAEESPNMIFINKGGKVVYANRKCEEIMGYTKEEFYAHDFDFYKLIAQEQVEQVRNAFNKHMADTEIPPYEYSLVTKKGERIDAIHTTKLITYEGEPAILGIVTDVTDRKHAEDRLRESEFLIRESQRIGHIGSYVQDFVAGTWKSSEVLDDIFGIDKHYVRDVDGWLKLVHPDHRAEMSAYLAEITEKRIPFHKEYRIVRHDDGIERWVLGRGELTFDEKGTLSKMVGTIQDITDQRKVAEELHLQVSALKSAANSVVITDKDGNIQWVNPAFSKMTGYTFEEALGNNPRILKSEQQDDAFYKNLWDTILSGRVWHGEIVNRRKNGTLYAEEMTITPVMGNDSRIRNFVAVKQDVTEQRNAEKRHKILEAQLAQAQKMESLGTLAGGIAHDFNNILGIILGHVTLLAHSKNDPVVLSNSIDTVTKAVRRGASLVRQILTFARKTDIAREPVDVNALITELLKMLQETFPKTIEIVTDLDHSIPVLAMDQTQLQQALMNLCINARDAMMERDRGQFPKGRLVIRTFQISGTRIREQFSEASASEYVCLEVSDTGVGFSQATKDKIFEPFFTTKGPGRGTGLGLAVVYGVVKGHQGFVDVRSEVDKGTTFLLYLPSSVSNTVSLESENTGDTGKFKGSETILVVEDEVSLLNLMTTVLVRAGYTVISAKDGVEAINQFEKHRKEIAMVLTDMGLPKLDGAELFTMLKLRDTNVKVLMASGYLEPQYKSELMRNGAKDFIQKPYQPEEVLNKIRKIIDAE